MITSSPAIAFLISCENLALASATLNWVTWASVCWSFYMTNMATTTARGPELRTAVRKSPGERVGWPARIGAGRQHARRRIAVRHHRADAASPDIAEHVPERSELRAHGLGDAGLDVQLTRPIDARVEGIDEGLRREARRLHGLLGIHPEHQHVQDEL